MSTNLKRRVGSLAFSNFPATAALKHFAYDISQAFIATANRTRIPRINSVIDPSFYYESGPHHYVGGWGWEVIAGPKGKNGQLAFLTAKDVGYQIDKFQKGGVGHREGPANALVPYRPQTRALTVRQASGDSRKFGEL